MNSFYGGKEGRSYAIIEHFNSTTAMVEAFKLGAGYTKVNYGEYVIIDTIVENNNPDSPDNGKIYRRGLDYTNSMGGAIYVGQIQGPKGRIAPLTLMNMTDFDAIPEESVIDGRSEVIQSFSNLDSIIRNESSYDTNKFKIGYKNYAQNQDGLNMQSAVGIDVPKPVIRFNAVMVQPSNLSSTHSDITNYEEGYAVDLTNLAHQSSLSSELSSDGVLYYDYQIAIPKTASNISVSTVGDYGGLQLNYQTVVQTSNGPSIGTERVNLNNVKLVDGLRKSPNSDVYQYHLTGSSGWEFLGNAYGQFHVFANFESGFFGDAFATSDDVIDFLNEIYPYGIRVDAGGDKFDMSQAGWLISANYSTVSALYAFDYTLNAPVSYSLDQISDFNFSPNNSTFNGWYKIQSFEDGLSTSPQEIVLIGSDLDYSYYSGDYGTVSSSQKENLKDYGLWFIAEDTHEKWWQEEAQ